jgi:hypothetical protein
VEVRVHGEGFVEAVFYVVQVMVGDVAVWEDLPSPRDKDSSILAARLWIKEELYPAVRAVSENILIPPRGIA